jgi:acyl-CoA-dependent ceramide synthase
MLKYLGFTTACDVAFGVFLVTWFLARHVSYLTVVWSVPHYSPSVWQYGCYDSTTGVRVSEDGGSAILANVLQPFNDPNGLVCWNSTLRNCFLGLLLGLQVLTLIWFAMILRVAWGVISGKAAEDIRSDDEEDDEIEIDLEDAISIREALEAAPKPRTASPALAGSSRGRRTRGTARTSAISIPGHGDRKELLGRIGCDKPT